MKWANEALELRFEKLQIERDTLHSRFVNAVLEVQQKTGLKNVLLQNRINVLNENVEHQEAVIGELSTALKMPSEQINRKLEVKISLYKPTTIKEFFCRKFWRRKTL